jgi:hypothetical protein
MQVYLLTSGEYDDYQVHGAFASMEDAERAKVLWGFKEDKSAQIEELEVLTIPELPKHNETPYTVKIPKEEYPVYVSKGWIGITSVEEGYSFLGDVYRFYVYAVYEEDAKKKAISYFRTLSKLLRKEQQEEQWYPLK